MPNEDAIRWNARYQTDRYAGSSGLRPFLVENGGFLPTRGLALDLAMGMGGAAGFLLARGLDVVGVDISVVAARAAKQRYPALRAQVADLARFPLPPDGFDVATCFYYLDRGLYAGLREAIRPGGVVVIETLTRAMLAMQPETEPRFLLDAGELREMCPGWQLLAYREGWIDSEHGGRKAIASLVARRG
jgi:2-polyprenyl-3-methyl-5-hydroxy-6-metoxy-1,4-benzoquinol methylase